jgi:uncharacterized membrane protein
MAEYAEYASFAFQVGALLVLIVGTLIAVLRFVRERRSVAKPYLLFREGFLASLLLGLDLLIAADIIDTVIAERTLESMSLLGFLVVIRTFLSFSLEVELTGRLPWKGGEKGTA